MRIKSFISAFSLIFSLAVFSLASCSKGGDETPPGPGPEPGNPSRESFLKTTEYGLYRGGEAVMAYNRAQEQIVRNAAGTLFRIQNDDQTRVVACTFSAKPRADAELTVRYRCVGLTEDGAEGGFSVLKVSGEKVWLWNEESGIGILALVK